VGTVSRYLNGHRLKESNRVRVENAVRQLDYSRDFLATTFKTGRSHAIAAVLTGFHETNTAVIGALENILHDRGYHLIVCEHAYQPSVITAKLRFLLQRRVDGLLLVPGRGSLPVLREYGRRGIPVVVFNDRVHGVRTDEVNIDNAEAAEKAVGLLIALGHTRIATIAGRQDTLTGLERLKGFRRALQRARIPEQMDLVRCGDWTYEGGYREALALLATRPGPTALLAANYVMAAGALAALHEKRISIPAQLAVVSFGDPVFFRAYSPPITAIRQPIEAIASEVAELLIRRAAGDWEGFPRHVRLASELIQRESTAPPGGAS
jgi:DNA-binding LacI/PurR family transcriptional regulator